MGCQYTTRLVNTHLYLLPWLLIFLEQITEYCLRKSLCGTVGVCLACRDPCVQSLAGKRNKELVVILKVIVQPA